MSDCQHQKKLKLNAHFGIPSMLRPQRDMLRQKYFGINFIGPKATPIKKEQKAGKKKVIYI